jgi:hypothetical protein
VSLQSYRLLWSEPVRLQLHSARPTLIIISLNSINKSIFVMVKCCVLFELWTEFLNII